MDIGCYGSMRFIMSSYALSLLKLCFYSDIDLWRCNTQHVGNVSDTVRLFLFPLATSHPSYFHMQLS